MSDNIREAFDAWIASVDKRRDANGWEPLTARDVNMLREGYMEAALAKQPAPVNKSVIRDVFLRNGFTIKEGHTDLKPYVYAAADELLSLDGKAVAAAPAAPVAQEPSTFWVLFDATADKKYIKKMIPDGTLMFFDCESDALRAKARNPGTDYKRVDYYAAPPAAEQPEIVAVPRELLREALAWLEVNDAGYPTKELRALLAGGAE